MAATTACVRRARRPWTRIDALPNQRAIVVERARALWKMTGIAALERTTFHADGLASLNAEPMTLKRNILCSASCQLGVYDVPTSCLLVAG